MSINRILPLLEDLVSKPSVTPIDAGCQAAISTHLKQIGFDCMEVSKNKVKNLWARKGIKKPLLIFSGHTDVVPPGELKEWYSDPFFPTQYNGYLYGRGTADMKGSIAAFVIAAEEFLEQYPKHNGSIGIALTSDEEGEAVDGTLEICNQLTAFGVEPTYCLVGEPTSGKFLGDTCKNGRRGSLSGDLVIHGIQGHVAYSNSARNPLHEFAPALLELVKKKWDDGNAFFPETTFQVSNISSGIGTTNIIPGEAKISFNIRFSTESNPENLKSQIFEILNKYCLNYSLDWKLNGNPFLTKIGKLSNALAKAIKRETGIKCKFSTSGGTSDGRFLSKICAETLEFGPINATIHKVNECIKIKDLESLKNIYRYTIESLLL